MCEDPPSCPKCSVRLALISFKVYSQDSGEHDLYVSSAMCQCPKCSQCYISYSDGRLVKRACLKEEINEKQFKNSRKSNSIKQEVARVKIIAYFVVSVVYRIEKGDFIWQNLELK
jgi:hypothetical protein